MTTKVSILTIRTTSRRSPPSHCAIGLPYHGFSINIQDPKLAFRTDASHVRPIIDFKTKFVSKYIHALIIHQLNVDSILWYSCKFGFLSLTNQHIIKIPGDSVDVRTSINKDSCKLKFFRRISDRSKIKAQYPISLK